MNDDLFVGAREGRRLTEAEVISEQRERIEQLERERDDLFNECADWRDDARVYAQNASYWRDRAEKAEQDAERYRWLREHVNTLSIDLPLTVALVRPTYLEAWCGDDLDAAIDAARKT